eukprot:m.1551426 g.1551426  ORF g.1551426 m.1551426 type:complete len:358 (+) comp25265_c0_seq121:200-1273(+)
MRLYPKRRRVHPRSDRAEEQAEKESSGGPSGHHRESIDSQHDAVRRTLSHPRIVTRGGRVSISSGATEDEFGVASPVGFNATVRTSTMTQHGTELVAKDSGMSLDGGGIDYSLPPLQCGDGKDTSSDDFFVDFRCGASRVTEVSTSAQTAYMKAYLALYWTDLRVADWEVDRPLPEDLWGPFCNVRNGYANEMTIDDHEFVLVDRERGRLKRFLIFEGRVSNNLNLKEFPFDFNSIDIEFGFVSHWRSKNGEKYGTASGTPIYRLREVRDPREGDIIGIYWDGHIPEWTLHGASWKLHVHKDPSEERIGSAGLAATCSFVVFLNERLGAGGHRVHWLMLLQDMCSHNSSCRFMLDET